MTEQLAPGGDPNERLHRLYARFAAGGAGMLLTGNVMVHREHREHPRNVVVDDRSSTAELKRWADAFFGARRSSRSSTTRGGRPSTHRADRSLPRRSR